LSLNSDFNVINSIFVLRMILFFAMQCPRCSSTAVWRDGLRRLKNGFVQRYLCRKCGYRFSRNRLRASFVSSYSAENRGEGKTRGLLLTVLNLSEKKLVGGIKNQQVREKIFQFAWWLKKEGYRDSTIKSKIEILQRLVRLGANLFDGESVKTIIATQKWSDGRRANVIYAYTLFAAWAGVKNWVPPRISIEEKIPWLPLERELDDLISGCSLKISCFLQLLKETGFRAGEAFRLRWADIDFIAGIITLNCPEKKSKSRQFRISRKLLGMLANLKQQMNIQDLNEKVFRYSSLASLRRTFEKQRKKLALKLQNPRLQKISFHTIRHWKATITYHTTKDILYTMRLLGHKSIKNTLKYTQLIPPEQNIDEYISKVASNTEEARQLIEKGFEYICTTPQGLMLFRKRKMYLASGDTR